MSIENEKQTLKRQSIFWPSFWSGLASPAYIYGGAAYRYRHKSEAKALRGDWLRVGGNLRAVMEREQGKATTA